MNRNNLNRILIIAISLLSIAILIFPYSTVFVPLDNAVREDENWQTYYVFTDIELMVIYLPFILLWPIYLLLKKNLFRKIISVLLVALSFVYFVLALENVLFISPDFFPGIGAGISIFFFPLLLVFLINRSKLNTIAAGVTAVK